MWLRVYTVGQTGKSVVNTLYTHGTSGLVNQASLA